MEGLCEACGQHGVVDRAHILTRASGSSWDDNEWIPLCRRHHIESGQIGWFKFCERFPKVKASIESRGFVFVEIFNVKKIRRA